MTTDIAVYGLLPQGFVPASQQQLLVLVQADEVALLGQDTGLNAEQVVGAINSVIVPDLAALWELAESVYSARDPGGASFTTLDSLAELTGTIRNGATHSHVALTFFLNPLTTIPQGSLFAVAGQPTNRWATLADAVNSTSFFFDLEVTVQAQAVTPGPVVANAGTITVPASPNMPPGLLAVRNFVDAVPGVNVEQDAGMRLRREQAVDTPVGESTLPAMYASLLTVSIPDFDPVVFSCTVEENETDLTDSLGRPPHTVEAIVQFVPGLDGPQLAAARAAFAQALWQCKPGGVDTDGAQSGTALDVDSVSRAVNWTEAGSVSIYVAVTVQVDSSSYAGDAAVTTVVDSYFATLALGQEVIRNLLLVAIEGVPGVIDTPIVNIGLAASPTLSANIPINSRAVATVVDIEITDEVIS